MKPLFPLLFLLPAFSSAQDTTKPQPKPSPYDSAHYRWRRPVPRHLLRELQPDRPGVTDTPFTVDAGHVQLEIDALRLVRSGPADNTQQRDLHAGFTVLKLGLSRRTAVQVELPLYNRRREQPQNPPADAERHTGFGDVALRLKHNFLGDQQDGSFALAVAGFVRLPTGGQVGDGAAEYGLVLPLDIELSDKANLEAQLETDLNYDRDQARRYVRLVPSAAVEYDFTEKFGLVGEAVAQWNTQQRRWQASLNFAPILKLTDNFQLDAGTHLALNRRSERHYFVGFTLRR